MKSTDLKSPSDLTGRIVVFFFLALIPLVTLVPYPDPPEFLIQDLGLRWFSAAVFLLCAIIYFRKPAGPTFLRFDFSDLIVLALLAWVLLSVKNSKEAFESFYSFRGFLALALWWFVLRNVWQRWPGVFPAFEKVFLWTAYIAAAWICVYMAGRGLGIPFFKSFIERKGMFINENIGAGFLGLALLWGMLKKIHGPAVSGWGLGLLFIAWALTQSRGAFVAMVVVVLLYLLLHMKEVEQRLSKWDTRQWLVFAVAVTAVLICCSYTIQKLFDALEVDPRALNRWELWKSSFVMATSQPLLGFGPGTFADVFPAYQPADFWNTYVAAAHNEYLQTVIECGWPALLLVLLFFWAVLRETGSRLMKTAAFREVPGELLAAEGAFFLLVLEGIHNMVDFTFHEWCHRLVLLGFVTFALSHKKLGEDIKVSFEVSRRAFLVGAALLVVFVFWVLGVGGLRDYLAQIYNFNATLAYQQQNLDAAEDFSRKSVGFREDFMEPWDLLGAIEDVRGERSAKSFEKRKYFEAAEQCYEKAGQLSPYSLTPLENRARLMVVQGRFEAALEIQNQLVQKAPEYPPAYIDQAELLLRMGRAQEAIASAQKAIDLDYSFIPSYLLKARAMEALGKKRDAIQVYKTIEEILKKINNPDLLDRMKEIDSAIQKLQS